MAIDFEELFKATVGLFNLQPKREDEIQGQDIQDLFVKILDAESECKKIFDQRKPPVHVA